jgi:hypothetical protein
LRPDIDSDREPASSFQKDWPTREVYFNPNAQWSRYKSIHIDSVTLWADEDLDKLSAEDQQMLTDTLYTALDEELGKYFEIADHAGPDTIRVRAALTQAKGAVIVLLKKGVPPRRAPRSRRRTRTGQYFLSNALKGKDVGLEEVGDGIWSIVYYNTILGRIDLHAGKITWNEKV